MNGVEVPKQLVEQIYKLVESVKVDGRLRKGTNETTKSIEKGEAQLVITAEDVSPKEIIMHFPVLCKEKNTPFVYIPSKSELGAAAGLPVSTSSIAIVNPGDAKKQLLDVIKDIENLEKASSPQPSAKEPQASKPRAESQPAEKKEIPKVEEKKVETPKPEEKKEEPIKEKKPVEPKVEEKAPVGETLKESGEVATGAQARSEKDISQPEQPEKSEEEKAPEPETPDTKEQSSSEPKGASAKSKDESKEVKEEKK